MTRTSTVPALLLLAGTSEAGKSSAGVFLAELGARRIKIRTILEKLASGRPARHEGVAVREGFDHREFVDRVLDLRHDTHPVLVVESFIDALLAATVRQFWPGPCAVIFITAPLSLRITRLAAANGLSVEHAEEIVRRKDGRKQVEEQLPAWRSTADYWIENTGEIVAFREQLRDVLHSVHRPEEQTHS